MIIEETSGMTESEKMAVRNSNFRYLEGVTGIVLTGTSGIWKYRVWSDGTAECWGKVSCDMAFNRPWTPLPSAYANSKITNLFRSVDATEESVGITGSVRYTPDINYPFEFSEIPNEQITVNGKRVDDTRPSENCIIATSFSNTVTKAGRYMALRAQQEASSSLSSHVFSFYVVGNVDLSNLDF